MIYQCNLFLFSNIFKTDRKNKLLFPALYFPKQKATAIGDPTPGWQVYDIRTMCSYIYPDSIPRHTLMRVIEQAIRTSDMNKQWDIQWFDTLDDWEKSKKRQSSKKHL